jgi:hypothetical protein
MSKLAAACVAIYIFGMSSAGAQNNATASYYEIKNLIFWSKEETVYPNWAGFVSVEFTQPLVWNVPGACSTTTVAIRPQDNHLMSAVQTALASGKPVRLYVDDAFKIDGNCMLRALQF